MEPQAKVYEERQSNEYRRDHIETSTRGRPDGREFASFLERTMPINYAMLVFFVITPGKVENSVLILDTPIENQHGLEKFQMKYPDASKTAFIIMQFRDTSAHQNIYEAIKTTLKSHGIIGLRADKERCGDDLLQNVITLMHGCGFGIAVFERIEGEAFNPNVSLEVGYLMALRKPICLLKDKSIKTLCTDIIGKIYQEFDPYDPLGTISQELSSWLSQEGLN